MGQSMCPDKNLGIQSRSIRKLCLIDSVPENFLTRIDSATASNHPSAPHHVNLNWQNWRWKISKSRNNLWWDSKVVSFGHDRKSTRPRLEPLTSLLMMRRRTNQISQRSPHQLSFDTTDPHQRVCHGRSSHIQTIRGIGHRSVTMTVMVDASVFMQTTAERARVSRRWTHTSSFLKGDRIIFLRNRNRSVRRNRSFNRETNSWRRKWSIRIEIDTCRRGRSVMTVMVVMVVIMTKESRRMRRKARTRWRSKRRRRRWKVRVCCIRCAESTGRWQWSQNWTAWSFRRRTRHFHYFEKEKEERERRGL